MAGPQGELVFAPLGGVGESGRLVLRLADGTMHAVAAGDVIMAAR